MLSQGLVGGWCLDEDVGLKRASVLGARLLTETGGSILSVPGKIGNAAKFTASAVNLVNADGEILSRDAFTLACWINCTTIGTLTFICFGQNGTAQRQWLGLNGTSSKFAFAVSASVSSEGDLVAGGWNHVALTYNNVVSVPFPGLTTYLNGSIIGTHPTSAASYNNPTGVLVGGATGSGWTVLVDEAYMWNRALNPAEITNLYTAGNAGMTYPWNDGKSFM